MKIKRFAFKNFFAGFRVALSVFCFLFISAMCYAQQRQDGNITVLRSIFKLRLNADYKFMFYDERESSSLFQTTRPLDLGIGFSILNFTIGASFSIPFQHPQESKNAFSLDLNFNNYWADNSYTYGYIKYNSDFYSGNNDIDLTILNMGISQEFILNKNHSIRSAYILDRKQSASNGSFLVGGGIFYTSIRSESADEDNKQKFFYFGPNFGYSFNWIIGENFFINLLSVFGAELMVNKGELSFGLMALPKMSIGYHGRTWSANIYINYSNLLVYPGKDMEFSLISGNIGATFVKRF